MGFLADRWETLREALGVRRFVIAAVVLLVVRLVAWLNQKFVERGMPAFLDIPEWTIWIMTIFGFVAYFLLEHAVQLRRQLAPKLRASFNPNGGSIVTTPAQIIYQGQKIDERQLIYLRGMVEAISDKEVPRCTAYLVGVNKKDPATGNLIGTELIDSIPLTWAVIGQTEVAVPKGVKRYFEILTIDAKKDMPRLTGTTLPLMLLNLFRDKTTYELEFLISGDGIAVPLKVEFVWDGDPSKAVARQL